MKKIFKWITSSNRRLILVALYLVSFVLMFNIVKSYIFVKQYDELQKKERANLDTYIEVKGQYIYIDGEEVYRFLPVQGGTLSVKDPTGFGRRDITVRSFMLGEIPVTTRLHEYVYHNNIVSKNAAEFYFEYPANNGTMEDWQTFINLLNKKTGHKFRLPTNDEWEYAARGGNLSLNYKYAGSNNIDTVAYYKDNCKGLGLFVCKDKKPNELGFYDMSGCIWELTSTKIGDVYKKFKTFARIFPGSGEKGVSDIAEGYISRGGAYNSPAEECALNYIPSKFIVRTGARLVMDY